MAREQTESGKKKAASRAYIDAQAKTAKAKMALESALERYEAAADEEKTFRDDCLAVSLPVSEPPKEFSIYEPGMTTSVGSAKP